MDTLETIWAGMAAAAAAQFRATEEEKHLLESSILARFAALLPAMAGCVKAERSGYINLCLFIMERTAGKNYFLHTPEDDRDILKRLEPFQRNMTGGDAATVIAGLARMGLIMLEDYRADQESDRLAGKYNPLNAGAWDYEKSRRELTDLAVSSDNPDLDLYLPLETSLRGWWEK